MTPCRLLVRLLAAALVLLAPAGLSAQTYVRMVNGATLNISACDGSVDGIEDDGGSTGVYSNYFDGSVVLSWDAGSLLTLQGSYDTESGYDWLDINDGTGSTRLMGSGYCNYSTSTGTLTITFHTDGSVAYSGFQLTWSVSGNTGCSNSVTNLQASNFGTTSATLTWNATTPAGPFHVICDGDTITATTTSITLTGLNAASQHTATVMAAGETSTCCRATVTFRTTCDTVHMPWVESFEGMPLDTVPLCWTVQTNFDNENFQPSVVNNYAVDGSQSLMLTCGDNATGGHFGLVFGPRLDLGDTGYVRFKMRASHSGTYVVLGTCCLDSSYTTRYDFTPIGTVSVGTSWNDYHTSSAQDIAPGRSLAFYMLQSSQSGTGRRVYIDAVNINECGFLSGSVSNIESDGFKVEWATYGSTSVTLHVRPTGTETDVVTIPAATSPFTVTGLDPATYYTVLLTSQCGTTLSLNAVTADSAITADHWCMGWHSTSEELNTLTLVNATATVSGEHIDVNTQGSNRPCYVISPEFNGLAGKQIAVRLDGYYANVTLGLMRSRNDTSTFTPLTSCYTDYFQTRYLFAEIPDTSTATYVALRHSNLYYYIHYIEIGDCLVDSVRVVHRRGTSIVLGVASNGPNDTILVEYGPQGFEPGTGTIRSFVGQRRLTIDSLQMGSYGYDFFVRRPCTGTSCSDARIRTYTAYADNPQPFCHDFSDVYYWDSWGYGHWTSYTGYDNSPNTVEHPFYWGAGMSLRMASYGFSNNYYSAVVVPDVPLDSGSILSFYVTNMAPDGQIILGNFYLKTTYGDPELRLFDTIQLAGYGVRQHYVVPIPAGDSTFDGRIYMRYQHSTEYMNFSAYIDEVQITHAAYLSASVTADSSTANITVQPFTAADSVFEVTLRDEADVFVGIDTINASEAAHFTGLSHCTTYKVYVRPLIPPDTSVCPSYATYFTTSCGGGIGVHNCFTFDRELSYELPYGCTSNTPSNHSVDTSYLHLFGTARVCLTNYGNIAGRTLSMLAAGHGSMEVGYSDTLFANFTPFDTIVIAAGDTLHYAFKLPDMPSDTLRIALRVNTPGDTIMLDNLGISLCPHIDITVDGNTAVCTTDNTSPLYYLFISDTAGNQRMALVNTHTYIVNDLMPGWRYDFSWQCAYDDEGCRPHVTVQTDNQLKVPYCIDFQNGSSTDVANAWDFVSPSPYAYRNYYSSYVYFYGSSTRSYLILPPLDSTVTVATLDGYMYRSGYSNTNYNLEIGVLTSGSDTSSFLSLYSAPYGNGYFYPEVDLSGHAGRRIAIRNNSSSFEIYRLFIHPYSPMTVRRTEPEKLELLNSHSDYYVHAQDNYYGFDTIIHVDSTYYQLDMSGRWHPGYVYLQQVDDSLGTTCRENSQQYYLSNTQPLPWCWNNNSYYNHFLNYNIYSWTYYRGVECSMFYGPRTSLHNQVIVLPGFAVDSLKSLNIKFAFASDAPDTQMVEIGVLTDAFDTTTFVPVDTVLYYTADSGWVEYQVSLGSYTGSNRWVAFRYNPSICPSSCDYTYSYIGQFCIDSCAATGATAKLIRWNTVRIDSPSGIGGFYAVYHRQGYSDYTITYIDTVPTTITLPGDTKYEFYFRCDSSTNGTCRPIQEITTLGTPLEVPSCIDFESVPVGDVPPSWTRHDYSISVQNTYANSGNNSLEMPIGSQSYVVTGDISADTLNTVALTVWLYTTDPRDYVEVGAMINPTDLSSFTAIRSLTNRHSGVWQRHIVILSNAPVDAHYIGLRARSSTSATGRSVYIDDLHMTPCAVCDMRLSNVNPTEFTVEWDQAGTPNITIAVESGGATVQTLHPTSSPMVVTGLNPLNPYTIRFNVDCGDTGTYCTSAYSDSATLVAPSEGGGCINPTDLYSSQATFFSGTYNNPYAVAGAIDYGIASEESRHTVCYDTSYRDPRTGGLLRAVPEGATTSLRLGNWSTNSYAPEAEGVIYSLTVDTSDFQLILLRYAAVLQDPMHAAEDQPRFRIEVLDSSFTPINPGCTSADFIADASLGWNSAPNSVLWKDWTSVGIDLSAYHGQQAYVRLTTYDCNEGSHYGYAYFTLECMRKRMETTACGAIDSNTFTAPPGFKYRWYSSLSSYTLSTSQSITMATADITYFCDLSKIDNAACQFTISAYGGTRYPMASADTSMTISGCQFHVNFTNTSTVSADGFTPLPGEECESAFWNFGNGQTATTYNASTVYTQPGTYTVMLVSGIAGDACKDTLLWSLVIDYPTHVSITGPDTLCYGAIDTLHLHNGVPSTSGEWMMDNGEWILPLSTDNYIVGDNLYTLAATDAYGCIPTASHALHINPIYRHMDTLRICSPMLPYSYADTVFDPGTQYEEYHLDVQSIFGCDSSYHLWLTVSDTGSGTTLDTMSASICDNQSFTFFDSAYTEQGTHITIHLDASGFCDSIHTLLLDVRPTSHTDTLANECDQFTWYGVTSTVDTTLQRLLQNSVLCDSTVTLGLTLRHSTDTAIHHYIVENQVPYLWNGLTFTADTTSCIYHTTNAAGCDSTIDFSLTIYLNSDTIVDSTVCEGMLPLVWNGVTFNTSDPAANPTLTLQATLVSSQGADSVVTMQLHLKLNSTAADSDTIVQNQLPWSWNGLTFTSDHLTSLTSEMRSLDTVTTIANAVGCDSTINYSLLVYWNRQTLLDSAICDDLLPLTWEGLTFTQAGTLDTVIPTAGGADSTLTLTLTVYPTYDVTDTLIFCPTQDYIYEGVDYGGPIQFDSPHLSVRGCDSLVHVVLTPRDTTFRLAPLYSFDGSLWLPFDTIVFGCAPDTLYLRDTTRGATAWQWTAAVYDTVLTSSSDNWNIEFDTLLVSPTSLLSVAVTSVIDGVTCIDTIRQPVYIFRTPEAEFDWNPPLPALDKPEVTFHNTSSPFDSLTYLWRIPPQAGSLDYDTTSEVNPFYHWGQDGDNMEGDYDVQLVAYWLQYAADTTVHHVCTDTTTHTVTITNDYLQFPNLVTPNGDGNNDIWRVVNLLEFGNFPTNELWIYNQWGVEIYHVRNIREESDFWNPNATESPDGTYYYRFSARGDYGVVKRNGIIEVLRK